MIFDFDPNGFEVITIDGFVTKKVTSQIKQVLEDKKYVPFKSIFRRRKK